MKKFLFLVPFMVIVLALSFVSCSSAPATPEQPPAAASQPADPPPAAAAPAAPAAPSDPAPSQASLDALNDAIAKVEAARKRAGDFNGSTYFPSDWNSAEAQYASANALPRASDANVADAITAYQAAADAYDSIFTLAVPLYAQAMEDEITMLWEELIALGVRDAFPEILAPADETAILAYDQYEAGDYYSAKDSADKALMMYQSLKNGYNAMVARFIIIEMGFRSYDWDNYNAADATTIIALENYEADDIPSALENSALALQKYNLVLSAGWQAHAQLRFSWASVARELALENKADIAAREFFTEADAEYNTASNSLNAGNYEEASGQFTSAEIGFIVSSDIAIQRRHAAEAAITEANDRINESDENARQADIILEGGAE